MDLKGKSGPLFRTAADRNFVKSLQTFIWAERKRCHGKLPDEHRYNIYKTAFDQVIDHATLYKMLLTSIKKEYDSFITSAKMNDQKTKLALGKLKALEAQPTSLIAIQRRAAELQERVAIIQRDTADVTAEFKRLQESRKKLMDVPKQDTLDDHEQNPAGQLPGLTFDESLNPEAMDKHLEFLEQKRDDLLSKVKSHYVPRQEKDALDFKLKASLNQRDALILENNRLQLRYAQLTFLNKAMNSWEKTLSPPALLEFLPSKLACVTEMRVSEDDSYAIITNEFEEDDPEKVRKSELLLDYIERFSDLFNLGKYESAAYHAAKSPHGILISMEIMERFKSVTVYDGQLPPVLLFFQALILSAEPGKQVPGEQLSLEGIRCALKYKCIELATFAVTQHRVTYSEQLGDVIYYHGDKDPHLEDTCLALAQIVYTACGVMRKTVLSMCRRTLTSGALEYIYRNRDFTVEDLIFVLRECPSLILLQDLTQPHGGQQALLSAGSIYHLLLSANLEDLALKLLEKIQTDMHGALQKTILNDIMCSAESWSEIATRCVQRERPQLAQEIISTLLSQPGAMCLPQDQESAKLMEHVFM